MCSWRLQQTDAAALVRLALCRMSRKERPLLAEPPWLICSHVFVLCNLLCQFKALGREDQSTPPLRYH
jgi:hypothetical protein